MDGQCQSLAIRNLITSSETEGQGRRSGETVVTAKKATTTTTTLD